jgi:DNA-binding response OmpR family regulator
MKKILIVEDDRAIAEIQRDFLEIEGFEITICPDGTLGLEQAQSGQYDLILLDLMLPGMSGIDICKAIRGSIDIPIIMVTAKTEETDKIRGLGIGADDYISKPFSPTELVARVKANLAQCERLRSGRAQSGARNGKTEELRIGSIKVNLPTHRVFLGEQELDLKNKEYELLVFLMSNPDIVFSKEHLYERIWGMDALGDLKTVAVHINRLRDTIEKDPQHPQPIQTVWGAGYRFKV